MNSEKDFYDILRSKFNDSEPPFDEDNWKTMRKIIDESRAAKNRALFLISLLGLLIFAGGAYAFYSWSSRSTNSKNTSIQYSSSPASTNQSAINSSQISNSTNKSESSAPKLSVSINPAGSLNNNSIIKNQPPASNYAGSTKSANSLHQNSVITGKLQPASGSPKLIVVNGNSEGDIQTTPAVKSPSGINITDGTKSENITTTSIGTSTASSSVVKKETSSATTKNKIADSAAISDPLPSRFSDEPFIMQGRKNIFSIDGGLSWSPGWDYGSTTQGHGFNAVLGIGYMHYLKWKLFIKTGIQFSDFDNMSSVPYTVQHVSGNIVNDSVITTKRLYYLTIPVQLEWYFGKNRIGGNKNSFGVGGSVSYLVGSSSSVTTYQEFDNNPPVNIQQYSHGATLNGYTTWNTSTYGFYKRTFCRKFSMYFIFNYGLTDMKNNSFFGTNLFERDKGFKILASYSF